MALQKDKFFLPKIDSYLILCTRGFSANKGEQAFRKWFSRICEIRSLVKGVPLVALTATASKKTKEKMNFELNFWRKSCDDLQAILPCLQDVISI